MVHVRLAQTWTDGDGAQHAPGDMVDVDAGTLAELEQQGIVDPNWPGPSTTPDGGGHDPDWPGPSS